jgi:hypothetical protein
MTVTKRSELTRPLNQKEFDDNMQAIKDLQQGIAFGGAIDLTTPTPTTPGYFFPTVNGTYTNFGGLVIDLTLGVTTISFNGGIFKKQAVPIDLSLYAKLTDIASKLSITSPAGSITTDDIVNWNNAYKVYGVEWDTTAATTTMKRIGNLALHASLPVHSLMRRCILNDAGVVVYYLGTTDSTKKEDGITPANLDGTDGQVMVEIPEHYRLFESVGTKQRVLISLYPASGFTRVPKSYVSAYEAAVQRSTNKLASVVNLATDYRGGNNSATNDAATNTLLGRPATVISRTNFRTFARNRGSIKWNCYLHEVRKTIFWLYYIEYADMNCQTTFNSNLTANGYKQGGLGDGVTDAVSADWGTFNGYYPFVPCGITNSLGNASGVVNYNQAGWPVVKTFTVPTFRGIENPFGHLWEWTDGINLRIQADNAGAESQVYIANTLAMSDADYTGYTKVGLISRSDGYIKSLLFINGDIMPSTIGASSTTYWSDYLYQNIPASGEVLRGVLSGGSADYGATAGFGCSYTNRVPSNTHSAIGSRLCFLPEGV